MGRFDEKSILKTKDIKKVLLLKKNYNFQDFHFKIKERESEWLKAQGFYLEVYNFETLILKLKIDYKKVCIKVPLVVTPGPAKNQTTVQLPAAVTKEINSPDSFSLEVIYFNPQTNNDIQSINHIIATYKDLIPVDERHEDLGNCAVFNNQYIFRKRKNFYSYTWLWSRGEVKEDNYNADLSHEFSLNEYITFVKKLYKFKTIQRRKIAADIRSAIRNNLTKALKKKLCDSLED